MKTIQFTQPVATFHGSDTAPSEDTGFITGLVVLVALIAFFFYYLIPYASQAITSTP